VKPSILKSTFDLVRYGLANAAVRAKMWNEWISSQSGNLMTPSGGRAPRVNQLAQSYTEREDANLATCVRVIADAFSWLPLQVKIRDQDSKGNPVLVAYPEHEFNDLWREPHPGFTTSEINKHIAGSLLITGNSYLARQDKTIIRRPVNSFQAQTLMPKSSWLMFVKRNEATGDIDQYVEQRIAGAQEVIWKPDQIIHHRLYNINDPIYGRSSIEPLKRAFWTEYQAEMMTLGLFTADGTPRTVFTPTSDTTPAQRLQIEEFFQSRADTVEKNRLQVMPLSGSIDRIQPSATEMEFIQMRKFHRERTYALLGVPPFLGGVMEYANYANALVQESSFWRHTMIPLANLIADFLTRRLLWVLDPDRSLLLMYDMSGVQALQDDQLVKARKSSVLVGAGIWTPNEARTIEYGLDPVVDGDELRPRGQALQIDGSRDSDGGGDGDNGKDMSPAMDQLADLGIITRKHRPASQNRNKTTVKTRDRTGKVIGEFDLDESFFSKARTLLDERIAKHSPMIERTMKDFWRHQKQRILDRLNDVTAQGALMSALFPYIHVKGRGVQADDLVTFMDIAQEKELLAKLFEPILLELVEDIGIQEARKAQSAGGIGLEFDVHNPEVRTSLAAMLNKITGTNQATFDDIRRILWKAYNGGLTIDQVTTLINHKFQEYSLNRAKLIARTTMTGVSNEGSRIAWSKAGATHKIWVATLDSLTRDYHVMYNGERVGIDDYFLAGPEPMKGPGDPNASLAENVCNCRCTMVYDFDELGYLNESLATHSASGE